MPNLKLIIQNQLIKIIPNGIIYYFKYGNERSLKAKKNIIASFVIKVLSIFINLLLVPLTIHYINPTRYGIWLTLSAIIGWLSFFDIGFGNGLRNKFAEAIAKGNKELAKIYVSTTYAVLLIIICIVLLLFLIINPFMNWVKILNTPTTMASELSLLALIVFVFFCIQFILQLLTTIITANQQPAKASFLNLLGNILSLIIIYFLTKVTSGSLFYLGFALSITPVIVLLASSYWFYSHDYRDFAPSFKYVRFNYARNLMSLGFKFFFIQISVILLYQTNNMIIIQLFGPAEVTSYNIAFKYFGIVPMFFNIILAPFWSAFTDAYAKGELLWIRKEIKHLQLFMVFITILTLMMLIFSNYFYKIWIGNIINIPYSLSIVMALYVLINCWCGIYSYFLNGVGIIKLQLYAGIIGGIINIPLAIYFGKHFSLIGVMFPIIIIGLINVTWASMQYYKIINNRAKGIWAQ
jgi:O-antigen/teichoic acid export membrane protein